MYLHYAKTPTIKTFGILAAQICLQKDCYVDFSIARACRIPFIFYIEIKWLKLNGNLIKKPFSRR